MTEVKIEKMDNFGRGIAYINNKITFIPNALVGDILDCQIVREHKKYNIGQINEIIVKSDKRIKSDCIYAPNCGGCALRFLNYENTLLYKKEKVENLFKLNKINLPKINIIKNEQSNNYRNKVTFKVNDGKIGFYEENSHKLIPINNCLLANEIINEVLILLPRLKIINGEVIVRVNYNKEVLLIIESSNSINFNLEDFKHIKLVGVVLNKKTIYGNNFFYERINNSLFKVSYDAFFQVNPFITQKLFEIIGDNIKTSEKVLDLYSGVGTLSVTSGKKASLVYSVEVVKNAVLDAVKNFKLNKLENAKAFLGKTKDVVNKIDMNFDTIIIDPPRSGVDKDTMAVILNSSANKIIYVSCDLITLIRDLKILEKKYDIVNYYMLDMFSYTYHIESFVVLKLR